MRENQELTEAEIRQVTRALELLAICIGSVYESPHHQSKLITEGHFNVKLGFESILPVCALIDCCPNPQFGQAPCSFNEALVMVGHNLNDSKLQLCVNEALLKNQEAMQLVYNFFQETGEMIGCEYLVFEFSKKS